MSSNLFLYRLVKALENFILFVSRTQLLDGAIDYRKAFLSRKSPGLCVIQKPLQTGCDKTYRFIG